MAHTALIWLIILSITGFLYLISDGSALGMSVMIPFLKPKSQQKAMSLLLPVWDLNQTWLVYTLAGLYGGFSLGFSLIMKDLYLPAIFLVLMFILRGAAIEYALKSKQKRWLYALAIFSMVILGMQVYVINSLIEIVSPNYLQRYGPNVIWFGYFLGGLGYVLYMLLLGLNFLREKQTVRIEKVLLVAFIASMIVLFSFYAPLRHIWIHDLIHGSFYGYFPLILLVMLLITHPYDKIFGLLLKFQALMSIGVIELHFFPTIFPNHTSYLTAASNQHSLLIMIVLSFIMLPLLYITITIFKQYFRHYMRKIHY